MQPYTNIDHTEIAKFSELAKHWWDPQGPCKPLHRINPVRLHFVQQQVKSLAGKKILDIGCGGGIFSEGLAEQGAIVTGIDMSEPTLVAAKEHCQNKSLSLRYFCITAEEFAQQHSHQFDVITCMELLEHVPDPLQLIQACTKLLKPEGHVFFSTINRTFKAYALAILAAEYITNVLPKGTHDYKKFIKPSELCRWIRETGLTVNAIKGIDYQGITHVASLSDATDVNYILHAQADAAYLDNRL